MRCIRKVVVRKKDHPQGRFGAAVGECVPDFSQSRGPGFLTCDRSTANHPVFLV